jgi:hypothetical protein
MATIRIGWFLLGASLCTGSAAAQQGPIVTQEPNPIGAGQVMIDAGATWAHNEVYTLSGLTGTLVAVPTIGITVGLSPIVDFQLSGGPYQHLSIADRQAAPLASLVTATGNSTHAVQDIEIGAKIRLLAERDDRPSVAFRFSTRLPNAKHESGLGQDTTDFSASLLGAKQAGPLRMVGNVGATIMSEPLDAAKQNDVVTYGASVALAVAGQAEVVGEVNGRVSTRHGPAPVGTESRGLITVGARSTRGPLRVNGGVFFGLTSVDPSVGVRFGVTYLFHAFTSP